MSILTDADRKFLLLGRREARGFHLATKWYLRGWEPLPYQWAYHQLETLNTTLMAGIAAGKTTVQTSSVLMDCISTPYFRALNTAVTAKQAELAFDMAMSWIEGNEKLEHLIADITLRPFPVIKFHNFSEWEFRTAGTDARYIRGSEYDRIGLDEPALDPHGEIVKVLRGRLRGVRPDGTSRLCRLDVYGSPGDALWIRERYAKGDPVSDMFDRFYRSLRVATWDNTRLSPEQIEAMKAEYPPEYIDVEMGGMFPDYGFSMFPSGHINACIDQSLYDAAYIALYPDDDSPAKQGYHLDEDARHGVIHFEMPRQPGHAYIMAGDPGTDNYPKRNSPCVAVADITGSVARLVYFHWGSGRGSYSPFLTSYKYAIGKYDPIFKGIDATGPQKALDELAFENVGIETDKINFGQDKSGMLNALSMDITGHKMAYPPIKGVIRQLSSYTAEDDKKMAQDIVMTLAQISYLKRFLPAEPLQNVAVAKANFRDRNVRTTSARRR